MLKLKFKTPINLSLVIVSLLWLASANLAQAGLLGWLGLMDCCSRTSFAARTKFLQEQARLASEMGAPKWGQNPACPLKPAAVAKNVRFREPLVATPTVPVVVTAASGAKSSDKQL